MKQTKINMNLDGLDEFRREIGDRYRARVGILGTHAQRDDEQSGINNAELGLIQMFGSFTNNIPARDFLRWPLQHKSRELVQKMGGTAARRAFAAGDYKRIFEILGAEAVAVIEDSFATGGFGAWAPNKPATIRRKKSSAPLIDTAELRKAQSFDVVTKSQAQLSGGL